ncbi:hypothetical protein EVJ58_g1313 [Rhodofomes roseus]|uniref:HECT domain-containing protein n=1 Tax=Rhodofomes roseus TaxID=34475 RepID=A0A4Y9Z096_9APHY|nr:hypothetical protein EVJ58_g1313 [Rhodofomes roseus]
MDPNHVDLAQMSPEQLNILAQRMLHHMASGQATAQLPVERFKGSQSGWQPGAGMAAPPPQPPPTQPPPTQLPPTLQPSQAFAPMMYTSHRLSSAAANLPAASAPAAAAPPQVGFQPFLGLSQLEPGAAPRVNHARLSSSSRTSPAPSRPAAGPSRTRGGRARGPARAAPVLPRADEAYIIRAPAGSGGDDLIKVTCQVYPKSPFIESQLMVYHFKQDSWTARLREVGLCHDFDVPPTTLVSALAIQTLQAMCDHTMHLRLPWAVHLAFEHEQVPLQLLGLRNKGAVRSSTQLGEYIGLARSALIFDQTIENLLAEKHRWGNRRHCIANGRLFVRFYATGNLTAVIGPSVAPQVHTCIAGRLYHDFMTDTNDAPLELQPPPIPPCEGCDAGDEVATEPGSPTGETPGTEFSMHEANHLRPEHFLSATAPLQSRSLVRTTTELSPSTAYIPAAIWEREWASLPVPAGIGLPATAPSDLRRLLWQNPSRINSNSESDEPRPRRLLSRLAIEGQTMEELVAGLKNLLRRCANENDFTDVIGRPITFRMVQSEGETVTLGEGVDREVWYTAFHEYAGDLAFVAPRLDNTYSLVNNPLTGSDGAKRTELAVFGALAALLILDGVAPVPLDPVFIHYAIHGCDFHSVTKAIMKQWHSSFALRLELFIEAGSAGDITGFSHEIATYADPLDVSGLRHRTAAEHAQVASRMLYRALFGAEGPNHVDTRSFMKGFALTRPGTALTFPEVARSFVGGTPALLKTIWKGAITGYSSISQVLDVRILPSVPEDSRSLEVGGTLFTLDELVKDFLFRSGIPSSAAIQRAQPTFSRLIDLVEADEPHFRPRWFHVAACGNETVNPDYKLKVLIVGDDDGAYYCHHSIRERSIAEGKISWRTCLRQAAIPASYFHRLALQDYSSAGPDEPTSLWDSIDNWLLVETLSTIGGHGFI